MLERAAVVRGGVGTGDEYLNKRYRILSTAAACIV